MAGIGFTMSLFIAGEAFPEEADFAAAKIAVFAASALSAIIGVVLFWGAGRASPQRQPDGRYPLIGGARRPSAFATGVFAMPWGVAAASIW